MTNKNVIITKAIETIIISRLDSNNALLTVEKYSRRNRLLQRRKNAVD
jgi:hypothetical protein